MNFSQRRHRSGAVATTGSAQSRVTSQMTCIVTLLLIMLGTEASSASLKLPVGARTLKRGKTQPEAVAGNSCFDVLKRCKQDKKCREALRQLKEKCAVKAGSCNAGMRDLPVCASIMDTLTRDIFDLNAKCLCKRASNQCKLVHSRIYDNPCFVSVSYLRDLNMLPQLEAMAKPTKPTRTLSPEVRHPPTPGIFDMWLTYDDPLPEESDVTSTVTTTTAEIKSAKEVVPLNEPTQDEVTESKITKDEVFTIKDELADKDRDGEPYNIQHNESVLLHVVAIGTGALVFLILAIGLSVVIFLSLRRKQNNNEKPVVMT